MKVRTNLKAGIRRWDMNRSAQKSVGQQLVSPAKSVNETVSNPRFLLWPF